MKTEKTHGVGEAQPQHRGDCGIYRPSGYDDCRCTCGVPGTFNDQGEKR